MRRLFYFSSACWLSATASLSLTLVHVTIRPVINSESLLWNVLVVDLASANHRQGNRASSLAATLPVWRVAVSGGRFPTRSLRSSCFSFLFLLLLTCVASLRPRRVGPAPVPFCTDQCQSTPAMCKQSSVAIILSTFQEKNMDQDPDPGPGRSSHNRNKFHFQTTIPARRRRRVFVL